VILLLEAELAAISAMLDWRTREFQRLLILTMGTGLGAALVLQSN
jgi:predicted NBD/HSP70 family sugar kinase